MKYKQGASIAQYAGFESAFQLLVAKSWLFNAGISRSWNAAKVFVETLPIIEYCVCVNHRISISLYREINKKLGSTG